MQTRWLLAGAVGLTSLGLVGGLIGTAVQNNERVATIERKKVELNTLTYAPIPEESRVLYNTYSPAYPSPSYEN